VCLGKVAEANPDVVVLDLQLPDRTGLEVFEELRRSDPRRPVVFITAHGTTATAIEAMKHGAFDYLVKLVELEGRTGIVTARLVQLLDLPPQVQLKPQDATIVPIALVPEQLPLAELPAQALNNRPELLESRACITATLERWRAAKVSPWVPKVQLS
jgi:DNA-binding NarL/FixJ family response regulator